MSGDPFSRRARHLLEYLALRAVVGSLSLPPRPVRRRLGRALGLLVHALGVRRRTVRENLGTAFPERTVAERDGIARACFAHFGELIVDTFDILSWTDEQFRERVTLVGKEHIEAALARGRGVIVATHHFGAYDVCIPRLRVEGYEFTAVYKKAHNPHVDAYMRRLRTIRGARVAESGIGIRHVFSALKRNELVAILADQDAGEGGLFIPFFGRPASTLDGLGEFARRTGASIVLVSVYSENGAYRAVFEPLSSSGTVEEIMTFYNRRVEEIVRARPEQYFWLHRRWKTPPP